MKRIIYIVVFATFMFQELGFTQSILKGKPTGTLDRNIVSELSGIIPALQSGEYWGICDSRNGAEIYRFSISGKILQRTQIRGCKNIDWEAITRDHTGNLYVGDIGDNNHKRDQYFIYQIKEPAEDMQSVDIQKKYTFRFSDGKPHNCEGFVLDGQKFYIFTKETHKKHPSQVFCLEKSARNGILTAQKLLDLNIDGPVTDAVYDKDKGIVCILTYPQLYLFSIGQTLHFPLPQGITYKIRYNQCEGICIDKDSFILSNEKGNLWKFALPSFK